MNIFSLSSKRVSFLLLSLSFFCGYAQELEMTLTINDAQYQFADKSGLQQIKIDAENFVNERRWTEDTYELREKIKFNLVLTIDQSSTLTNFICRAQIQSSRPIYASDYKSSLFNYLDNEFNFIYNPGMNFTYNDNNYSSEITTLLAYYAYLVLGLDYDSFSENGGKDFYLLALRARDNHPNVDSGGWAEDPSNPNIRFWLVENLLNPQFTTLHTGLYTYHRLALDKITEDHQAAHDKIITVLENIQTIYQTNPTSIMLTTFFKAKSRELIALFKGANDATKDKAIKILSTVDPTNKQKYLDIKKK